ncbi:MAG: formiminoglutamate deiminase [Frankiales bacterium]|nr:formiminoglutamate deiminase [Frankiales bacterium]
MSWWCELAWLDGRPLGGVRVTAFDGVVTEVAQGERQPGDVVLGGLVLPGLANAHSHAFHRALRGRTHADGGTFWTWRDAMYRVADRLDPDSYLQLARATFAEMVLAGYTVVGEFHYLHHGPGGVRYDDPNSMGLALVQAADDAGIRLTLLDACYLQGGLDGRPLEGPQLRFGDGDVDAWAARIEDLRDTPLVRHGVAAHSVRAVPTAALPVVAGYPIRHVHLSEQPAENAESLAVHGCTPTRLLDDAGFLGGGACAVHATHVSEDDVVRLAGTSVCMCPTTERDLADGIGPARALRGPICLGSDQHAVIDPFEEARALEADERLGSLHRGRFTPTELVTAATRSGYAALGWDGGELRVGAVADLVSVALDTPRTAGADPAQLLLAATSADVTDVVVAGRQVVTAGRHVLGDVGRLLSEAIEVIDAIGVPGSHRRR